MSGESERGRRRATLLIRATGWDPAAGLMLAVIALLAVPVLLRIPETARRPLA